jgi:hypothetical protein
VPQVHRQSLLVLPLLLVVAVAVVTIKLEELEPPVVEVEHLLQQRLEGQRLLALLVDRLRLVLLLTFLQVVAVAPVRLGRMLP